MSRIITISGLPGTGKEKFVKNLISTRRGFENAEVFSGGKAFKTMAQKRNVSLAGLQNLAIYNPEIDYEIDNQYVIKAKRAEKESNPLILVGMLPAYILYREKIPAHHIVLFSNFEIRVLRIAIRETAIPNLIKFNFETAVCDQKDRGRFYSIYEINSYPLDPEVRKMFDRVIDTSTL